LKISSFVNPDGKIVVVVLNKSDRNMMPKLRIYNCTASVKIPARSLTTLVVEAK